MDEEYQSYLRFNYAVKCRHCDKLVMDPDKSKGQVFFRGKCPSCGKHSSMPTIDVENIKLSKKQRKRLAKEAKQKQRAADRAARGKYSREKRRSASANA